MTPTAEFIKSKFAEFNRRMFGGRLPELPIELTAAKTFLGKCEYTRCTLPNGLPEYTGFKLRFSTSFNLPESEIEDTIIHEMIHYFILWSGLHDTSPHGPIFRSVMASINAAHVRHISISYKHSSANGVTSPPPLTNHPRKWHVIAAVYLKSGQTGVKVLPRVSDKIQRYKTIVSSQPQIDRVELYLHDNPFFNIYPTSAALRIHTIDRASLEQNLKGARKLN